MAAGVVSRAAALGALTAAGQLLIIGSLPAYSKAFDPAAYGEYLVFVGLAGVLGVFAGVRYDSAIVLPRNDRIASALADLVMLIATAVALLIASATLLTAAFGQPSGGWAQFERQFGYGLAAATFIGALQRCLSSWCVRSGRFMPLGWGQFAFALVTVVAQLLLAGLMSQRAALIWGYLCALLVQVVCLAVPMLRGRGGWTPGPSLRGLAVAARRYRRFPTYMVGYALASSVRDRLVQIALGIGAGAAAVGRFGLAYRVTFAPNSLLYSAISPLFFAIASRGTRLEVGRFAAGLVETLFVVMLVPYVAFALEAPALTDGLLAQKWHGTGPYLQALAGPALMLAATCWLDRAFDSFRRQNVAFALEASFTFVSVTLVALLAKLVPPVWVAWVFGLVGIIYYWTYFMLTFTACGFPFADFRRVCTTGVLAAVAVLILGALAHQLPELIWRLPAYLLLLALLGTSWLRYRGGWATLRQLLRSRIAGGSLQN